MRTEADLKAAISRLEYECGRDATTARHLRQAGITDDVARLEERSRQTFAAIQALRWALGEISDPTGSALAWAPVTPAGAKGGSA